MSSALSQQFQVSRLKVEASILNTNIPQDNKHAESLSKSCYFEHHVKMELPKAINLSVLREQLQVHKGYLSKNALATVEENHQQEYRFVTQRFRTGKTDAEKALQQLLAFLRTEKIPFHKVIQEFNIFDSNADLDKGWMQ